MQTDRVEFKFRPGVNLDDVEMTVRLAFLGASSQHPAPIIRLYARYQLNRSRRAVVITGADDIVKTVAGLTVSYLERELGATAFTTTFKPQRTAATGSGTAA